jgi:hypothetical protein
MGDMHAVTGDAQQKAELMYNFATMGGVMLSTRRSDSFNLSIVM